MPSSLASHSPFACVICIWLKSLMHICQLCISLESSQWKCLWRITENEYSCQLVPEENLQASSLHCQSLCKKPYGKNIRIFNQTAGLDSICVTQWTTAHSLCYEDKVNDCFSLPVLLWDEDEIRNNNSTHRYKHIHLLTHKPPQFSQCVLHKLEY